MTAPHPPTTPGHPAPVDLDVHRSPDVGPDRDVLVLLPVGSTEQHGPHLPLGTDAMVATHVCRMTAAALAPCRTVLVAPPLAYGASGEHEGFPGTVSIGHEALRQVLVEIGRSACQWAGGLIVVNGHGGNAVTVRDAVLLLRYEGRPVAWSSCDLPGGDAHAGHTETSMLLDLAPSAVRMHDAVPGCTTPVSRLLPRLRAEGVRAVSDNGVLGDPTGATRQEGRHLLQQLVRRLVAQLSALDVMDDGRLRTPDAAEDGAPRPS